MVPLMVEVELICTKLRTYVRLTKGQRHPMLIVHSSPSATLDDEVIQPEALREGAHEPIVEFSAKFLHPSVQTGISRTGAIPKCREEMHHPNIELSIGSQQLVNTVNQLLRSNG